MVVACAVRFPTGFDWKRMGLHFVQSKISLGGAVSMKHTGEVKKVANGGCMCGQVSNGF